jgi:hypothetical protein
MGGGANLVQILQGLNEWGLVSVLLIMIAALIGRYLLQFLGSQVSKHLDGREAVVAKIDALYRASLDKNGNPIQRADLMRRINEIEDRCVPEKCPFHEEMRDNSRETRDQIVRFCEEARTAREETRVRMNEIFGEYQTVSHALLGLVGKYLEVSGGAGGKSTS